MTERGPASRLSKKSVGKRSNKEGLSEKVRRRRFAREGPLEKIHRRRSVEEGPKNLMGTYVCELNLPIVRK